MEKDMKKTLLLLLGAMVVLAGCKDRAKIEGKIGCAKNKMVYLEYSGLTKTEIIDSTEADGDGEFTFRVEKPHFPDLYRVRLGEQTVVLVIDSATEEIEFEVPDSSFHKTKIEGSEASADIQRLRASHYELQQLAYKKNVAGVDSALKRHTELAQEIILKDTKSMAAYYAINQTFNGIYYFSPYDKKGLQFWSAVATAFDLYYPDYERSKELKAVTLDAIKRVRDYRLDVDAIMASGEQTAMIDIELPNRRDDKVKLSSLKGKMVVIDFSAYSMEQASAHMLFLRELYDVYHEEGLEIYQVSVDPSKLQWLEQSRSIPWICVHDERSTESPILMSYNVTEIPTFFLMDYDGTILGRFNHENLEYAIMKYMK